MSRPVTGTQVQQLNASIKRLNRSVERCADTIRLFSAAVASFEKEIGERGIETPLSSNPHDEVILVVDDDVTTPMFDDQPIVLHYHDQSTVVIETVHGVKDVIKVPKQ